MSSAFEEFQETVAYLRHECPWDRKQTHASLRKHLLEEAYETLEAIDNLVVALEAAGGSEAEQADEQSQQREAASKALCDELGDLLYQVFFHSLLASERGDFAVEDVATGINEKLIRRHPHVFGDLSVASEEELAPHWEAIKKSEGERESVMDGIPSALPALLYASKVQRKAASLGCKPPEEFLASGVLAGEVSPKELLSDEPLPTEPLPGEQLPGKLLPAELSSDGEIDDQAVGRLLFAITQLAAQSGIDPESALRSVTEDFRNRFRELEANSDDLTAPEARSHLWQ